MEAIMQRITNTVLNRKFGSSPQRLSRKRTLTSMTFGFSYNKLADFNNTSLAYNNGIGSSITEIFAERMNGVPVSIFKTDDPLSAISSKPKYQPMGGGLAYQTRLLEAINSNQYSPFGPTADHPDRKGALSELATMNPAMRRIMSGSIGEYDFSGGFNFNNILYLGFTVGLQTIHMHNENNYTETYNNNEYNLISMNYIQRQRLDGTGVNFKFGAILVQHKTCASAWPYIPPHSSASKKNISNSWALNIKMLLREV